MVFSSGPIMPRITECLAAKQEVAPTTGTKKPCTFGCAGVCVGPLCPGHWFKKKDLSKF